MIPASPSEPGGSNDDGAPVGDLIQEYLRLDAEYQELMERNSPLPDDLARLHFLEGYLQALFDSRIR